MIRNKLWAAAISGFILCGPGAAQLITVEGQPDVPTEVVLYGDLDLASDAGRSTLNSRVRGAAKRLCLHNGTEPIGMKAARQLCFDNAVADADKQVAFAVTGYGSKPAAGRGGIVVAVRK